jgi:UDP-glucose 4-epimerase
VKKIKHKKILVIGGCGFIGSHIVEELLKTDVSKILVYDNLCRGSISNIENSLNDHRCSMYEHGGDIRDIDLLNDAMKGMDAVIHLAGLWLLHCNEFPRSAFHVNIEGTFNVLEACVKNKIKKLVFSSSASVYGNAETIPMEENHPFNNKNFYGATKISGEVMCRAFANRFGLKFIGLRYMNVYGPLQDQKAVYSGVIPALLNSIDAGETPIINGDGTQAYDFIHVRDIARSNICAINSDTFDEFYNVGTGIQTSILELCELILKLRGSKKTINFKPYNQDDERQLVTNRVGSTEKIYNKLGFEPMITLEKGLKSLITWRDNKLK